MKKSGASRGQSASELISKRIAELEDWRGETLSRMRKLIKEADPDVVEEWKWMGMLGIDPSERNKKLFWLIQLKFESPFEGVFTNFVKRDGLPINELIASILARGIGRSARIASTIRRSTARNASASFQMRPPVFSSCHCSNASFSLLRSKTFATTSHLTKS
jgi:hypothetical protein